MKNTSNKYLWYQGFSNYYYYYQNLKYKHILLLEYNKISKKIYDFKFYYMSLKYIYEKNPKRKQVKLALKNKVLGHNKQQKVISFNKA